MNMENVEGRHKDRARVRKEKKKNEGNTTARARPDPNQEPRTLVDLSWG